MDLSVATIVKNEERNIRRMLESLEPLKKKMDVEIIVVDTGSTDNTISIAREYTDKVYEHKWTNDFAEMRNISLSYCTGKWILVLDADEELKEYDELITFVKNKENDQFDVCNVIFRSYTDSECNDYIDGYIPRILKNDVRYEGKIHELPKSTKKETKTNIIIYHYGYMKDDCNLMIYKYERNMRYLLEEKKNNNKSRIIGLHIYNCYSMYGMTNKAAITIKEEYNNGGEYDYNIAMAYGIELIKSNEYIYAIEVLELLKSRMGKIINIDIHYFLGSAYYQMKEYSKARNEFESYLEKYNYNNAGIIYSINKKEEVKKVLVSCLYFLNQYTELIKVYQQINNNNEASEAIYIYIYALLKCNKLKEYYKNKYIDDLDIELIIKAIDRYSYIEKEPYLSLVVDLKGISKKLDFVLSTIYLDEPYSYNIREIRFDMYYEWKGKILRELFKKDYEILFELNDLPQKYIGIYIQYLLSDYYCLRKLYEISRQSLFERNLNKLKLLTIIEKNY